MPEISRIRAVRFVNAHRIFFYSFLSVLSVWAVITNALKSYNNFYSLAISLSKSSRSVLILANFGILVSLLCGHVVQRIFFGALRPNEVERLYDRLWFFITESLLAFTIFRDEFDTPFALMFGFLLFVKAFHWLASDRIEWMDQRPYPGPPLSFHFRMTFLFAILSATDTIMFLFALEHTLSTGVGGMVLFASEYGILVASLMNTMLKYCLSTYDLRRAGRRGGENAPPWENKSMWIFYIELVTDFLKLTTYLVFFCVIIAFYGLPLNIIRDVYVTARSFITRLKALHRYQTATRNMDQRYPNATEEELTAMNDRTCIICREEMVSPVAQENVLPDGPNMTPKKLPCGHIFHFHCLRSWLERQQSCPTCRRNVLDEVPAGVAAAQPRNGPIDQLQQNALGAQPVPGQNPQNRNNPLGFLGRFFGVPNRLPDLVQGNGPNLNNNVNGQQPGIFINYHVQYQFPRRQNEDNLHAEQLQHLPQFAGFPGPGGAWQPWPAQEPAEPQPTPTATSPEAQPPEGPSSETQPSSSASPNIQPLGNQSNDLSAREAARQAALRRFGCQRDPSVPTPVSPALDPPSTPAYPLCSASGDSRPPPLIPLFDFKTSRRDLFSPSVLQGATTPTTQVSAHNTTSRDMAHFNAADDPLQGSRASSSTNHSPGLPSRLTEEQLARLDTLTRDNIDLRLQILDGVALTLNHCIDELLELRSALPPIDPPSTTTGATGSPSPSRTTPVDDSEEAISKDKGKGKEKAQDIPVSQHNPVHQGE